MGIERLNTLKIKNLKEPGYHCDGGGLYVQVSSALTDLPPSSHTNLK